MKEKQHEIDILLEFKQFSEEAFECLMLIDEMHPELSTIEQVRMLKQLVIEKKVEFDKRGELDE